MSKPADRDPKDPNALHDAVQQKLEGLPPSPGCYIFLDEKGDAVYVGKAKSLRSRVRSYFQESGSDERYFIPLLRRVVFDLETIVTTSEKEAAVLENELIKRHQPRFNVKLRDDKNFLCLRLDEKKEWPRLETVRRPSPDGARYFGPFHSATSARRTLHVVNKYFRLRTCSDADFAARKRPCLQYQIKRCPGPCVFEVDRAEYAVQASAVGLFLEGRHDELTRFLDEGMREAARTMEFERAAIYRDQLHAVETIRENQRVVAVSDVDQDVIGLYREGSVVEVEVLFVRSGRVSDAASYSLRKIELPDEEVLAGFLREHYARDERGPMPDEVLVPTLPDGAAGFAEWLSELRGRKVLILLPVRGPKKKLLDMANENARHAFEEKRRAVDDLEARLAEVQERLRLPVLPRRIECCDISHLGGEDTVGSIVSLENGKPDRKRYRSFTVKSATGGDDYAAMYEVLARRFRRARESENEEWELPDLFVVDGGRGQLNVALSAAHDLGVHDLPIVGLAKERETLTGEKMVDRVYLPGQKNGIPLRTSRLGALLPRTRARRGAPLREPCSQTRRQEGANEERARRRPRHRPEDEGRALPSPRDARRDQNRERRSAPRGAGRERTPREGAPQRDRAAAVIASPPPKNRAERTSARALGATVGVPREPFAIGAVDGTIAGPRPPAELRALVVGECLSNLGLGVHHERSVSGDRLTNRTPLEDQHVGRRRAVFERRFRLRDDIDRTAPCDRTRADLEVAAREEIDAPVRTGRGLRQDESRPRLHRRGPDRDVGLGARRPRRRRRGRRGDLAIAAGDDGDDRLFPRCVGHLVARDRVGPEHREVRLRELVRSREVQPELEELGRVRAFAIEERKHLRVDDAATGCQPLHVTSPVARSSAE